MSIRGRKVSRWTWHAEAISRATLYVGAVGDRRVSTFRKTVSMPSRSAVARRNWLWAPDDSWSAWATSLHNLTKATKSPKETPNGSGTIPTVVLGHDLPSGESRRCELGKRTRNSVLERGIREGGYAVDGAVNLRLYACTPASDCRKQQDTAPTKCFVNGIMACGFVLEVIHYVILGLICL